MEKPNKFIFGMGLVVATVIRATEMVYPEHKRIYDARFDYALLSPVWKGILLPGIRSVLIALLEKFAMGTPGMLFCRTRFIDDALVNWLENGTGQVVSLGAGFDTRAYRIPGIDKTRFFELDLPEPQNFKREYLVKVLGTIPPNVTYVPIDFDRQIIEDEMASAGFLEGRRTFFIWEGVTQYITAGAVDATLRFAARSAPGSQIAFTYIHSGIVDGSERSTVDQRIISRVARRGMPWVFGLDPHEIEDWLTRRGFKLVDQADASEYRRRYVTPVGRELNIYEGERMALGEVESGKMDTVLNKSGKNSNNDSG
jgi:methyltransferase (TIGR00027 family)